MLRPHRMQKTSNIFFNYLYYIFFRLVYAYILLGNVPDILRPLSKERWFGSGLQSLSRQKIYSKCMPKKLQQKKKLESFSRRLSNLLAIKQFPILNHVQSSSAERIHETRRNRISYYSIYKEVFKFYVSKIFSFWVWLGLIGWFMAQFSGIETA